MNPSALLLLPWYAWQKLSLEVVCTYTMFISILLTLFKSTIQRMMCQSLSYAINCYLCWRYPIKTTDGRFALPTCSYEWPNGQGDVGKFLKGVENSELWRGKHGNIYRIWSGMTSEVVLTEPKDIYTVFKDSDRHFKAANNNAGWLMGELLGQCLGLISQDQWRRTKAAVEHGFLHSQTKNYNELITKRTKKHLSDFQATPNFKTGLLDPVRDLRMLPFWICADVLYGVLTQDLEVELESLIPVREKLFQRMIQGGTTRSRWTRFLAFKVSRDLSDFQSKWEIFNRKAYSQALLVAPSAPIIKMYQAMEHGDLSRKELYQTIDEMLFANVDVTIGAISSSILLLAKHKEAQGELRQEINEAITRSAMDSVEWNNYLQSSSTLLMASILESARLRPLAAFSVPQAAPTDRVLHGFVVPAGTNYVVDSYALNIHNPFWGEDRTAFKPSRFLNRKTTETRYSFWRFGFGPRVCLGRHLADLIMKTLLAHLFRLYQVRLVDETDWDRIPDMWITQPDLKLACEPLMERENLTEGTSEVGAISEA